MSVNPISPHDESRNAPPLFRWIAARRITMPLAALLVTIVAGLQLPSLERDGRREAYIRPDHPALERRDRVQETFGLRDPIAIAVVRDREGGVFTPETLALVDWLTTRINRIEGIDPERVVSLATEKNIRGHAAGLEVEPFLDPLPRSADEAHAVDLATRNQPLIRGSLVAEDGSATLLLAEVVDARFDRPVYESVAALVKEAPAGDASLHVAGESALAGFRELYIASDIRAFLPLAFFCIAGILALGFRSIRGVVLPLVIVFATAVIMVGTMAACGVPFYVITSALPVIIVAIALADVVHIQSRFQDLQRQAPDDSPRALVAEVLRELWRPIVLTSVTDAFGFLAIAVFTEMPPMRAFGGFAAFGVLVAMILSLLAFPPLLAAWPVRTRRARAPGRSATRLGALGALGLRFPLACLAVAGAIALTGVFATSQIHVNDSTVAYFRPKEPIAIADRVINERFEGIHFLDVAVTSDEPGGILAPAALSRIEDLQEQLEALPHVNGSTSIVDALKTMNQALHDGDPAFYRLPEDRAAAEQFLLLYSASANPADFERELDTEHRQTLVRARLDTGEFRVHRRVVEAAEAAVADFEQDGLRAEVTGRVHLHVAWLQHLLPGYVEALVAATLAVWLAACVGLRSVVGGSLAMVPVLLGVALIHTVIASTHGQLQLGNSMVASIVIGLGVDFSLHFLERLRAMGKSQGLGLEEAVRQALPTTGRALAISGAAVMIGFGIVATSQVPSLAEFGLLIGVAAGTSFLGCIVVLPALVCRLRPRALAAEPRSQGAEVREGERADALV